MSATNGNRIADATEPRTQTLAELAAELRLDVDAAEVLRDELTNREQKRTREASSYGSALVNYNKALTRLADFGYPSKGDAERALDDYLLSLLESAPSFDVLNPCAPGELTPPTFLVDGLLYERKAHELFGRPGTNKSMLAVHYLAELASNQRHILLIEYEMDENAIGLWLNEMGYDRAALRPYFHQVVPREPWSRQVLADILAAFPECALVVLDNVAEAIASFGGDENAAGDSLKALAPLRDLAHDESTTATAVVDHLPHGRDDSSRGSTAKGALVDVTFKVETPHPVTRTQSGDIKLTCKKDRPSYIGKANEVWFAVGDGKGGLPIKRIATPGKLEDNLSKDGAKMIVALQDHASEHPGREWVSAEKVLVLADLKRSQRRKDELRALAAAQDQPVEKRERERGDAATVTEYRYAEVSEDDPLDL